MIVLGVRITGFECHRSEMSQCIDALISVGLQRHRQCLSHFPIHWWFRRFVDRLQCGFPSHPLLLISFSLTTLNLLFSGLDGLLM
jgi:hypothetical protein